MRECISKGITSPFPQCALKKPTDTLGSHLNTQDSGSMNRKEGTDFKKYSGGSNQDVVIQLNVTRE